MPKKFTSPDKNYIEKNFTTTARPKSVSPKHHNYEKLAVKKEQPKARCTYIHPETAKRCKNELGLYPQFCEYHTVMVHNVFIGRSKIKHAGNGLFAGPYGFKKGYIIGKYSYPWNKVSLGEIAKRCNNGKCWSYVFCDEGTDDKTKCWDGLDIRSTLMRNINDARGSGYKNNAYFDVIKGEVYVIASKNIQPAKEIYVNYGSSYW